MQLFLIKNKIRSCEPALIEELDGEADDLVIGDDPLVFVRHLPAILVRTVRGCFKIKKERLRRRAGDFHTTSTTRDSPSTGCSA